LYRGSVIPTPTNKHHAKLGYASVSLKVISLGLWSYNVSFDGDIVVGVHRVDLKIKEERRRKRTGEGSEQTKKKRIQLAI
jgi:hypothetical protein